MPSKSIVGHLILRLWRDYFGCEIVFSNHDVLLEEMSIEGQRFMIAQMPRAMMV